MVLGATTGVGGGKESNFIGHFQKKIVFSAEIMDCPLKTADKIDNVSLGKN